MTHKLLLGAALPAALIWGVAFYAAAASEDGLRQSIERTSVERARAIMDEIDRAMHARVAEWRAYSRSPLVQRTLPASNQEFEALEDRQAYIDNLDQAWRTAPQETQLPLVEQLTNNELARDMRVRIETLARENGFRVFGEVFITNRYGVNIAQTSRTSDYRQDDEDWWQSAYRDGLHVTEVAYDESAQVFSTDLCLRIDDDAGAPLGVLKAVLNIQDVVNIFDERGRGGHGATGSGILTLFTKDKRIIRCAGATCAEPLADGSHYFTEVAKPKPGQVLTTERFDGVAGRKHLAVYTTSCGFGHDQGLGWVLLLESEADAVYQPVDELRTRILLIAAGATVLALGLGGTVAVSLSRRVRQLAEANAALGRGDLDVAVSISGYDELAKLGASFNRMATGRKRAEEALRRAKDYTDGIISSMLDMLVVVAPDGTIRTVNTATCRVLGYLEEELIGQPASLLFAEGEDENEQESEEDDAWLDSWREALPFKRAATKQLVTEGAIKNVEQFYLTRCGEVLLALMSGAVMRDNNGEISGIVCVAQDITERKRLETEWLEFNRDLVAVNEVHQTLFGCRTTEEVAKALTDALVDRFRAYFARVWLVGRGRPVFELPSG